ncbi:MAG: phosphodiester glycosidase family protein [Clostridia bacterium]|nr:phosphodiester glycosidase family protein [Clostridia bacterium]
MKKMVLMALCLLLLCGAAQGEEIYRHLSSGNSGDDVLAMKERLYDLGYYTTAKLTASYTDAVCEVIELFQKNNGLPETGEADPYTQAVLFSDAAVQKNGKAYAEGAEKPAEGTGGDGLYREYGLGAYGDDVTKLKKQMQKLGLYSKGSTLSKDCNEGMMERITKFQQDNDLPGEGTVTAETQALLYLGHAKGVITPKPTATPKPTRTPKPTSAPQVTVELPETNEEGFLADPAAEAFVHEDWDDGHWYYIDQTLAIEICRYEDPNEPLVWYVSDIRMDPESETFRALLADGSRVPGHNFEDPLTIAEENNAVFAITDDNYGYRWSRSTIDKVKKYEQGAIVRDGDIKSENKPTDAYYDFPPLDVLAYYPDGSIKLYYAEEHDAQWYVDDGVQSTWAFGPILLKDGEVNQRIYDKDQYVYTEYNVKEPRQALGYYEPGHYVVITAKGRSDDSDGVVIQWMIDQMQVLGVTDAFNFDGGYTTVLYFMGEAVNKKENVRRTGLREVSSVLAIGTLDSDK